MTQPIYKHYKGGHYQVVTFLLTAYSNTELDSPYCKATIEHNLKECFVYQSSDGNYFIQSDDPDLLHKRLVLYHPIGSKLKYWIRTYDNFFEPIDKTTKRFLRVMI